jgi:hypothetical protein
MLSLFGVVRLILLVINGSFPQWRITKYIPIARGTLSCLSTPVWTQIIIGMMSVTPVNPSFIIYIGALLLEIWCGGQAFTDKAKTD